MTAPPAPPEKDTGGLPAPPQHMLTTNHQQQPFHRYSYPSEPRHSQSQPPPPPPPLRTHPSDPHYSSPSTYTPPLYTRHDSAPNAVHHNGHPPPPTGYTTPVNPPRPSPHSEYHPHHQEHYSRSSMDHGQPPHIPLYPPQSTLMQHLQHPPPTHGQPQGQAGMQPSPVDTTMHHTYPAPQSQGTPHAQWGEPFPPQYQYDSSGAAGGQPRRKAVRAAQACENCRAKKAKCDEARPSCGNCEQNNVKCEYRNLPPPKQDRSLLQLSEYVQQQFATVNQNFNDIRDILDTRLPQLNNGIDAASRHQNSALVKVAHSPMNGTLSTNSNHDPYQSPAYGQSTQFASMSFSNSQEDNKINGAGEPGHNEPMLRSKYAELHKDAVDMLQGELAIPPVHSTAAHDLRNWPTIKGFFKDIDAKYVRKGEHNHNLDLSIHAKEPPVDRTGIKGVVSSPSADFDDASSMSSSSDGRPAAAFVNLNSGDGSRGHQPSPGGRNANQSLSIDQETALRLLDSYLTNVHILQPFIDRMSLRTRVEHFVGQYCSEPSRSRISPHSIPEHIRDSFPSSAPNGAKKRKISRGPSVDSPESSNAGTRKPIQRTVENALILLVFALGKICDHKGPLPRLRNQNFTPFATGYPYSPADSVVSPFQNHFSASPFPISATPKLENSPRPVQENDTKRWTENIDVVPGAAYFSHAVSILGEVLGGNSLLHVQAHLLAGLYLAQLVHVYDCWKWINQACIAWQMLFKTMNENEDLLNDEEKLTYWACLICESDILAELEMVPSGISKLEDRIPIYTISNHHDDQSGLCQLHYLAQISIRKILNRAHTALYNTNKKPEGGAHGWAQLNSQQLGKQLEEWRDALPEPLRWNDDDPPADTINGARLRGKYFGARNIIFRPFLHRAINGNLPAEAELKTTDEDATFRSETITFRNAFECIEACKNSTVAFDNVPGMKKRLIVTNIFGTAHAQFGNMLVLGAACLSATTGPGLPAHQLLKLLDRTIEFLGYLAPLSPTMTTNVSVLRNIERQIKSATSSLPVSAANSFNHVSSA